MNYRKVSFEIVFVRFTIMPFGSHAQQGKSYEIPAKIDHSSSSPRSRPNDGYEIHGHVEGLKEGEKVTLGLYVEGKVFPGDSAYVKNGEFHLKGAVVNGPRYYNLKFEHNPWKVVRLLIDNGEKLSIYSSKDVDKIPRDFIDNNIRIEGSKATASMRRFYPVLELYQQTNKRLDSDHYLKKMQDSIGFDPALIEGVLAARDQMNQSLYFMHLHDPDTTYLSSAAIPYLVRMSGLNSDGKHPAILKDIYDNLNERTRNTFYGKELEEVVRLCVGQPFPPFNLPTPEGKYVSLTDIIAKSKVTLVHFWATTSYQRGIFQDELRALYKKYHDKGLNIIGVSSDTTDYIWKGFVNAQQFPWYNVSDLKGAQGVVGKLYKEYGTPGLENTTNVLIDATGKIIAWDAYGVEVQYYLWKAFGE